MSVGDKLYEILIKYWGHSRFRPLQQEIIESVVGGHDTLALMPTGGGKSICFQVPGIYLDGICLVISPLISLMKDQVDNLRSRGIKASAVVSGMSKTEIEIAFDNCIFGKSKFLYLSPERLTSSLALTKLQEIKINLIAVDEAHCISQWGYDFRPSYLRIVELREAFPEVPVIALTASATKSVRNDIAEKLNFKNHKFFQKSFERKNLNYIVEYNKDKLTRTAEILKSVKGSAVIYVNSRGKTKDITTYLNSQGIKADFYHAGLSAADRNKKQSDWMQNKIQAMVATNAFGMGIDKADVRTVIHADLPDSPEAYYQEAGRAGRDEKNAFVVLIYNSADKADLELRFQNAFPEIKLIRLIYHALGNYLKVALGSGENISFNFDLSDFASTYNFNPLVVINALKIIAEAGYIHLSDAVYIPSRLKFTVGQAELYNFQVQHPESDKVIKTILRSYGGSFDNFIRISEAELAKRLNIAQDVLIRHLFFLQKNELLEYVQQTDKPQLTYLISRVKQETVVPDLKLLEFRKQRFKERVNAMLHYAESLTSCRSMMLLNYFGETTNTRCGTCDYCRKRNKIELNDLTFEKQNAEIKEIIQQQTLRYDELLEKFPASKKEQYVQSLQWLIDSGKIIISESDILLWHE